MLPLLISFLLFMANSDCKPCKGRHCDVAAVTAIAKKIPRSSVCDVRCFLSSIGKECLKNAEFMEYSNEVLFKLMLTEPDTFIIAFSAEDAKLDRHIILREIANPVHDGIDVNAVKQAILRSEITGEYKKHILLSLGKRIE